MGWDKRINEHDILKMEDYLSTLMSPVRPREEFVQGLRHGLGQSESHLPENEKISLLEKILWGMAGFASAIVLLTIGIRAIVRLVRQSNLRERKRKKGASLVV